MGGAEEEEARPVRQGVQDQQEATRRCRRDSKKGLNESLRRAERLVTTSQRRDPIIGFLDETSIRCDPSRRRVLCTRALRYDEGTGKRSRTIFGFMAINGKDVAMVSESAKAPDMATFLRLVRKENRGAPIVAILDNAQIHRASLTRQVSEALGIIRTFLPPYSPDLNPIEFGWKDVKRELSGMLEFDRAAQEARQIAMKLFSERRTSYTARWTERFRPRQRLTD